jgi:hypothetical protein
VAVAVAGCGGGGGGSSDPKAAATDYLKALGSGDYSRACNDITAAAKKGIEKASGGKKCPQALSANLKSGTVAPIIAKFKNATVSNVKTTGNSGTATANVAGLGALNLNLRKEGGTWKVGQNSLG